MILASTHRKLQEKKAKVWRVDFKAQVINVGGEVIQSPARFELFATWAGANAANQRDVVSALFLASGQVPADNSIKEVNALDYCYLTGAERVQP